MEEIRCNPNAAAAGSRSPTSPVLNARDIANSILAETTRRIGVQNIVIGSRTGKPDAAGDLANSAVTHLSASREQYVRLETLVSSRWFDAPRLFHFHSPHPTILGTNSPLPLPTSLTHLNYLTSTSPHIREILTQVDRLERFVRLLRGFCFGLPPENPTAIYGLSPASVSRPPPAPVLSPKNCDRHAAHRFSLALQCVVNIGVRSFEPIRSCQVPAE